MTGRYYTLVNVQKVSGADEIHMEKFDEDSVRTLTKIWTNLSLVTMKLRSDVFEKTFITTHDNLYMLIPNMDDSEHNRDICTEMQNSEHIEILSSIQREQHFTDIFASLAKEDARDVVRMMCISGVSIKDHSINAGTGNVTLDPTCTDTIIWLSSLIPIYDLPLSTTLRPQICTNYEEKESSFDRLIRSVTCQEIDLKCEEKESSFGGLIRSATCHEIDVKCEEKESCHDVPTNRKESLVNMISEDVLCPRLTIILAENCLHSLAFVKEHNSLCDELQRICNSNKTFIQLNYLSVTNHSQGKYKVASGFMEKYNGVINSDLVGWYPFIVYQKDPYFEPKNLFVFNGEFSNGSLRYKLDASLKQKLNKVPCIGQWLENCDKKKLPLKVLDVPPSELTITTGCHTINLSSNNNVLVSGGTSTINIIGGSGKITVTGGSAHFCVKDGSPEIIVKSGTPSILVEGGDPQIKLIGGKCIVNYAK